MATRAVLDKLDILDGLEEEARSKLVEMKPTIEKLRQLDLGTDWRMKDGDTSQTVVTYPPIGAAKSENITEALQLVRFDGPVSLYIHIPFCNSVCSYCNYARSVNGKNSEEIENYLKLVTKEITLWRKKAGSAPIPVESIYIGGGTPTVLSPKMLEGLLTTIKKNFVLRDKGEFTLETSPATATADKFCLASNYGVNRVSMGVESFNPHILQKMGRDTNVGKIFLALDEIRSAGIQHIDIDLIRGYPGQTPDDLVRDLEGMRRADTPSVTSYQYMIKPKSKDEIRLGDLAANQNDLALLHVMFIAGARRLGYRHQEPLVDWFVKDSVWVYQQQIQKWMGGIDLIGIGLGAYGNVGNVQYFNHQSRSSYKAAIEGGVLPMEKATILSEDESMRKRVILGIKGHIDRKQFRQTFGTDVFETPMGRDLDTLVEAGALYKTASAVGMTPVGVLFAGAIQKRLFSPTYKLGG